MQRVETMNPFAKHESYNKRSVFTYRSLTIATWLLVVILGILHTFTNVSGLPTIWEQNKAHPTPFALNSVITSIYWTALVLLQIGYMYFLFTQNAELVNAAANVGSHYIVSNILQAAFILLWVRSEFCWCELVHVVNFFNLTSLYFRHRRSPPFVHIPVVTGPLAWTFVGIFWSGAVSAHAQGLAARIVANVFVWSWLLYGLFFIAAFRDYAMGFELSVLAASLAVEQLLVKTVALQWIFAFVIMAILFLATLTVTIPGIFGKELTFEREADREPLLDGED